MSPDAYRKRLISLDLTQEQAGDVRRQRAQWPAMGGRRPALACRRYMVGRWKNNSSKSSSTGTGSHCLLPVGGRTTPPNQVRLANGYRDPHLPPTAMIRYMVVVLARPIFGSHCLVEEQLLQIKF
jgi:hypothetical protein